MSERTPPTKAICFIAILARDEAFMTSVRNAFALHYGGVLAESEPFSFAHSSYYADEMGEGLLKRFTAFGMAQKRAHLVDAKVFADTLERESSVLGARRVNIDPGHLHLENVILATGKPFTHRVYLDRGVYADLSLLYNKKARSYTTLPWTYPDYARDETIAFLNDVRIKGRALLHEREWWEER